MSLISNVVCQSEVSPTDLYIVSGKEAYALFLESFWFDYDSTLINIPSMGCMNYTNQTQLIFTTLRQMHDNIIESSEASFKRLIQQNIPTINVIIENSLVLGRCDFNGSQILSDWLQKSTLILKNSQISYVADDSGYQSPTVLVNQTDYYDTLNAFILQYELIRQARNVTHFTDRNSWADFGKRMAAINRLTINKFESS